MPPRSEKKVAQWTGLFRNYGTAINYVCILEWAYVYYGLSNEWYGQYQNNLMKGQKKWTMKMMAGQVDKQRLLTEPMIRDLIKFCDLMGQEDFATLIKFA